MDAEFQKELRKLQEAAGIKYGAGIYDQIGSTAEVEEPKQKQAGTGIETDSVSEETDTGTTSSCSKDVDADGYFPDTEHGTSIKSTGPAGAKMGDNAAQKSMKQEVTESESLTESKRLVTKVSKDLNLAKVYFDTDYNEYCVKLYNAGKYAGEDTDYFTDDRDDAISTAKQMVSFAPAVNEMRRLAGLSESEDSCDTECEIEDEEDADSKEVIKEAYSSFYHLLQEEFKKAKLK